MRAQSCFEENRGGIGAEPAPELRHEEKAFTTGLRDQFMVGYEIGDRVVDRKN